MGGRTSRGAPDVPTPLSSGVVHCQWAAVTAGFAADPTGLPTPPSCSAPVTVHGGGISPHLAQWKVGPFISTNQIRRN